MGGAIMSLTFLSGSTTAAVAFAYPAMQTIKVVKESKAVKEDDETAVREHCYETKQWVMYWLLFSALYALECIFSVVGVYEYLPLWNEIKIYLIMADGSHLPGCTVDLPEICGAACCHGRKLDVDTAEWVLVCLMCTGLLHSWSANPQ